MTATPPEPSDAWWQTLAAVMLGFAVTVVLGHWWAGATFGYLIFAAVWGPIAAGHMAAGHRWRIGFGITGAVAGLVSIPLVAGWSLPTAIKLTGLLLILIGSVCFLAIATSRWFGRSLGKTAATVLWLTWLTVPLTTLPSMVDDSWLAQIHCIHPVVVLNCQDATAGDWTHQAIAYRWLTRLGQDVPFDWPGLIWPCATAHLSLAIACVLVGQRVVPRGTTSEIDGAAV